MTDQFDLNLDEKYKPKTIEDLVGQPHIRQMLENIIKTGKMPHLLLYGPPGVGKTSTVRALAHDLFDNEWRSNLHEYNASNTRGIDFVRNEIITLTNIMPMDTAFQIIFLDEADELTYEAQAALRQIIQNHTDTTKFIFACNYPENIIHPIRDRCVVMDYHPITQEAIVDRLKVVCKEEKIGYDEGILESIAEFSEGSLRKAIQCIDIYRNKDDYISEDLLKKEIAPVENKDVKVLLQKVFDGDAKGYEKQLRILYRDGYKPIKIFTNVIDDIGSMDIGEPLKQDLIDQTGQYEWRISQGSNDLLQMRCYLNSLSRTCKKYKSE